MRTLVISDLHIGDTRCENTPIVLSVLRNEEYDQVVLNGDIIDLWLEDIDSMQEYAIIKVLTEIAKHKKVVWVLGNHDWDARGKGVIPGALEADSFQITEGNQKVLCIHGHQVYEFQNMAWYTKISTRINYWAWKIFGIDIQRFFNRGRLYERVIRRRRKSTLERYGKSVNTVIMGHTHLVGHCSTNKSDLYDIGSLTIRRTYAVVEDGCVSLKKARKQ